METGPAGMKQGGSVTDLLTDTGEDDDVRIDRHTDGKDDTGDTRKGKGDIKEVKDRNGQLCVEDQGQGGNDAGYLVHDDHEEEDEKETDARCQQGGGQGVASQLSADDLGLQLLQFNVKTADPDI